MLMNLQNGKLNKIEGGIERKWRRWQLTVISSVISKHIMLNTQIKRN